MRALPAHAALLFRAAGSKLQRRFREREESVRVDIFETFRLLVRSCTLSTEAAALLRAEGGRIMLGLSRALRSKSLKTQQAVLETITEARHQGASGCSPAACIAHGPYASSAALLLFCSTPIPCPYIPTPDPPDVNLTLPLTLP